LCSKLTAKATLYLNLEVNEVAQHLEDALTLLQRPRVFALGLPLLLQRDEGGVLLNVLRAGGSVVNTTKKKPGAWYKSATVAILFVVAHGKQELTQRSNIYDTTSCYMHKSFKLVQLRTIKWKNPEKMCHQ
jgi:hypothetical protein